MLNFNICFKYLTLFVLALCSFGSLAQKNLESETIQDMESLRSQYQLPSFSVAIGQDKNVVFAKAIGFSDFGTKTKANQKTQYSVGSLAKPMTGIALAKLVDAGSIDLKSNVSEYVNKPNYTNSFTVEELAAHISGIPHDTPERDLAEFVNVKDHTTPFDAFYVFDTHPLLFSPGTEYKYSSNGYILLSAVVESAAKKNYVDFLKTSIWEKLGMVQTELDTSFAGAENEAAYYADIKKDEGYVESLTKRDRSFLFGGGGFISTPTDLVKMSQAVYDEKYLSPYAKHLLYTPVKLRSGEVNSEKYSLGWRVGKVKLSDKGETWTALHHGGVTDKASTAYLLVIPECKASIAFATNYIPEKFWHMRGKMAEILKKYINESECTKANKLIQPTAKASAD
ncbi:serine hydrolase domain-containing protein [Paraglaciecola sp.]|uniref:serine hydrolase domain-containing protein n=1 Tax=Paraglaciecola sp. TaxID=1920173 RepID=UPI003263AE12